MTSGRFEAITSVERRRRWSSVEKQPLMAATLEPVASVSAVARAAGIQPSQLYGWRRQLRARPRLGFAPVEIAALPASAELGGGGANLPVPEGIRLFYQPPRTPELQPAEHLWPLVDEQLGRKYVPFQRAILL